MSEIKKCIECEAPILSKNMSRHMQNAHGVLPKKRIKLEDKSSKWKKMDLSHLLGSTDSQNESETKDAPNESETKDAPNESETKDAPNESETKDAPNEMSFDREQAIISIRAGTDPKVKCAHCSTIRTVSNFSRHRKTVHAEIHAKNPKIVCTI
jgi:hypothetical protein